MNEIAEVRPSPIAGTWYSRNPGELARLVDGFLRSAQVPASEGVVGVIAPHAGHRYSGRTAGYAFATVLEKRFDLVAVLSPMHAPHPAALITTAHKAYGTPLGNVLVDQKALAELQEALQEEGLSLASVANDQEHSLEIELPFLQRALAGSFTLLPIMVRSSSPKVARQLGKALAETLRGKNALLVGSTDLSHFFTEEMANEFDGEMLRRMENFAPDSLFEAERDHKGYACGVSAVAAMMWAARDLGADRVQVLHHSTSGEETGDYRSVVGYGAAVVLKPGTER